MIRHARSQVVVRSTAAEVTALAFDLPRWPEFLPHYRWVKVLARDGVRQTVEMACWRGMVPLKWRSHLWVDADAGRMRFRHVGGPARGMEVEWRLEPEGECVRVTIEHRLSLEVPIVRSALGQWVVGELFVAAVAARTLACLKRSLEGGPGATAAPGPADPTALP